MQLVPVRTIEKGEYGYYNMLSLFIDGALMDDITYIEQVTFPIKTRIRKVTIISQIAPEEGPSKFVISDGALNYENLILPVSTRIKSFDTDLVVDVGNDFRFYCEESSGVQSITLIIYYNLVE